jgi:hypothetical protein
MAAGRNCVVLAGENGCFAASYYDEKAKRNRILVAHVGEDGINADTYYAIQIAADGTAEWQEVK